MENKNDVRYMHTYLEKLPSEPRYSKNKEEFGLTCSAENLFEM